MVEKAVDDADGVCYSLIESDHDPVFSFSSLAYENPFDSADSVDRSPPQLPPVAGPSTRHDHTDTQPILCNSGLGYLKAILAYVSVMR
jgi:hypothetical protein